MKKFKAFQEETTTQESITRRTMGGSYGQPKKKTAQTEWPPKGPATSSKPKKKTAASAKTLAKIQKALDREKKNDKPGMTKRSDDRSKKSYQSGKAGDYYATKYAKEEMTTTADAGIPQDTSTMMPKKKTKPLTRHYIEVNGKRRKITK